jgi:hypothetical protein
MPIVINEFEVVPQQPGPAGGSAAAQPQQAPGSAKSALGPLDVGRVHRHLRARALRVWAH